LRYRFYKEWEPGDKEMGKGGRKESRYAQWSILFCISLFLFSTLIAVGCDKSGEKPVLPGGDPKTSDSSQPAYGDLLIQGSIGDASNLIPMLASDSASHDISGLIFNGLV
jgi:hypothetical protein